MKKDIVKCINVQQTIFEISYKLLNQFLVKLIDHRFRAMLGNETYVDLVL